MAISSMTGYGERTAEGNGWTVSATVKTLNHKYLEVRVKGLDDYEALELQARDLLTGVFRRGRVDAIVRCERSGESGLSFDVTRARQHWSAFQQLIRELGLQEPVSIEHLTRMEGALVRVPPDPEGLWPVLEQALRQGAEEAQATRAREGTALARELEQITEAIREGLDPIESALPRLKNRYRERLRERVEEMNPELELDSERLEQEVVLWAERTDIAEELGRLRIHLDAVNEILMGDGPAGRTLDFLGQEMYREANTMAAKAKDGDVTGRLVEIKSEIERFREQVRNIE